MIQLLFDDTSSAVVPLAERLEILRTLAGKECGLRLLQVADIHIQGQAASFVPDAGSNLLLTVDASRLLGIEAATLRKWRSKNRGPAFVQISLNNVRYRLEDIQAFITARRLEPKQK